MNTIILLDIPTVVKLSNDIYIVNSKKGIILRNSTSQTYYKTRFLWWIKKGKGDFIIYIEDNVVFGSIEYDHLVSAENIGYDVYSDLMTGSDFLPLFP